MVRLQHLALKTNNLEATCAFYLELLGLSGRCDAGSGHLWLNFDDGFVLRFDRSEDAPNALAVQYMGLELESFAAVDRMHERLAAQVSVYRDVRETYRHTQGPYGFFVADPSGYLIKVFRYNTPTREGLTSTPLLHKPPSPKPKGGGEQDRGALPLET